MVLNALDILPCSKACCQSFKSLMSTDTLAIDFRNWTAHVIVHDQHCKKTRVVSTELG